MQISNDWLKLQISFVNVNLSKTIVHNISRELGFKNCGKNCQLLLKFTIMRNNFRGSEVKLCDLHTSYRHPISKRICALNHSGHHPLSQLKLLFSLKAERVTTCHLAKTL